MSKPAPNPKNPVAVFDTTEGSFEAEIYLDSMPLTASNFIDLCKKGFYNGLHFHRVIPNFMCQFGCPFARDPRNPRAGTGNPDPGTTFTTPSGQTITRDRGGNIPDENTQKFSNIPGSLSMANTGAPNSGGAQFFMNTVHNDFLDWFNPATPSKHPVFGQITKGFEIVDKISKVRTAQDKPVTPVQMKSITIRGA